MRVGAQTSEASGSLWNQLLDQYLQPNGLQENPREYVEGRISQQMVHRLGKERNTCALIEDFNGRLTQQEPGAGPVIMDLMCGKDGSLFCIRHLEAPIYTQSEPSGKARVGELVQIMRSYTAHLNKSSHRVRHINWIDCRSYRMDTIYSVRRFK